jgi:hypothetical protein
MRLLVLPLLILSGLVISLSDSDMDCYVIRKLLDPIFDIWWEPNSPHRRFCWTVDISSIRLSAQSMYVWCFRQSSSKVTMVAFNFQNINFVVRFLVCTTNCWTSQAEEADVSSIKSCLWIFGLVAELINLQPKDIISKTYSDYSKC